MIVRLLFLMTLIFGGVGCVAVSGALSHSDLVRLVPPSDADAELIYRGNVYPPEGEFAVFEYERWVRALEKKRVSVHVTRRKLASEIVVLQRAIHSSTYELEFFEELHKQTGGSSSVTVESGGGLRFAHRSNGEERTAREAPGLPTVVGPTLYGYVLQHWSSLLRGEELRVRFAEASQLRSYNFSLRVLETNNEETVIEFEPTEWPARWVVAPMLLHFESGSRRVLRYEGIVPPKHDHLASHRARVEYEFCGRAFL